MPVMREYSSHKFTGCHPILGKAEAARHAERYLLSLTAEVAWVELERVYALPHKDRWLSKALDDSVYLRSSMSETLRKDRVERPRETARSENRNDSRSRTPTGRNSPSRDRHRNSGMDEPQYNATYRGDNGGRPPMRNYNNRNQDYYNDNGIRGRGNASAQVFVVTTRSQKREREDRSDQGTREIDWGEFGHVEKSPEKKRINLNGSQNSEQDEDNQESRGKQSTLDEADSEDSDSSDLFSSEDNDEDWSGIKMAQRQSWTQGDRGRTGRKFSTWRMLEEIGDHPGAEPILSQATNTAGKLPRVRNEQHIRAEIQITSTPRKDLIIQRPQREINPPLSHRNREMFGNTVNESEDISESLGKAFEELQSGTLVSSKSKEVDLDNCLMETDSMRYVGAPKQDSELNITIEKTKAHGRDSMQIESKKDKPELKWNVERFSSGGRLGVQVLVWNEEQESIEQRPQTGEPSTYMQSRYNQPEYQPRVELTRLEIPTVGNSGETMRTPFTIGDTSIYRRNEEREGLARRIPMNQTSQRHVIRRMGHRC
ncbi:hypothetical protein QAD02_007061 [Eretmocerus hayati]|uniref:Uncharacterized protein n=1 Tax=Eretmocerus hayati TaxID=131215 RepID=A0ACC2N2V7_9HYME|nr:hypothetical protein QAD02_007061 [Eretmocerus hayati]